MNVTIKDLDWYQAWVVSSDFGQGKLYLVYMELFNLSSGNFFYEKHMRKEAGVALQERNLQGFSAGDLSGKAEAAAKLNVMLKNDPTDLKAKKKISTNTGIDWPKINVKTVAYKFAAELLKEMLANKFGDYVHDRESGFVDDIEVDLGEICVVSQGKINATGSTIKIGAERISPLNGKNQVSFKVSHCGGI